MVEKPDLLGMELTEIQAFVEDMGAPRYRGVQLFQWMHKKLKADVSEMSNLPKDFRQELRNRARITNLEVLQRKDDPQGSTKLLLSVPDGEAVEPVVLRYEYGTSVCVSSQLGCAMGCAMCASTLGGLKRNLTTGEMCGQVIAAERVSRQEGHHISRIVVMGIGEPMENYESLVRFLRIMNCREGMNISYRRMTISTCGHVPQIIRLSQEGIPVTLSVSLHAPVDSLRDKLMPINRRYPLSELLEACKTYFRVTGRRVTIEYTLMKGVNDSAQDASRLASLLRDMACHVNLIPYNPVPERQFERPSRERVCEFAEILRDKGINVTVRREIGAGTAAACGQLRRLTERGPAKP